MMEIYSLFLLVILFINAFASEKDFSYFILVLPIVGRLLNWW
jgi:hypothetical protein